MMTIPEYEDLLNGFVVDYLKKTCLRYTWQVPSLGGRMDFVGVRPSYELIGIEAKTSKWKRAFIQAKRYRLCVDKVYIALPATVAIRLIDKKEVFKRHGIGLISLGEETKILIGTKRSHQTVLGLRENVLHITRRRNQRSQAKVRKWLEISQIIENDTLNFDDERMNLKLQQEVLTY